MQVTVQERESHGQSVRECVTSSLGSGSHFQSQTTTTTTAFSSFLPSNPTISSFSELSLNTADVPAKTVSRFPQNSV